MSHFNYVKHESLDEWHAWRDSKIGASDINYIMSTVDGFKGYKSREKLLHEKITGIKEKGPEFIFEKGHKFEADVRPRVEMIFDLELPAQCVVSKGFPWDEYLSASLDGFNEEKSVNWECKLVGKDVFKEIQETQRPPDKYKYQIQQQLLITKAKYCILTFGTSIEEYDHIKVYPDDKMQNKLVEAAKDFWDDWQKDEKPPEGFFDVVKKVGDLNDAISRLTKELKVEKEKLKKWDFKNIVEKDAYKYSRTASIRSTFNKEKALVYIPEGKQQECYVNSTVISYKVSKKSEPKEVS